MSETPMEPRRTEVAQPVKTSRATVIAVLVGYAAFLGLLVGGMFYGRTAALATYGGPEAQGQWQDWREAARAAAVEQRGGVKQSVPASEEPPALVLMRDYFVNCLLLVLVLGSALYFTFAFMIVGLFRSGGNHGASSPKIGSA